MEHTKGKMKYDGELGIAKALHQPRRPVAILVDKDASIRKANAAHLVKCWNAFEKDGAVDKLLEACEESDTAKHNLEKIIAYCKTDDETYPIAEDLEKMVLPKLCKAEAAIAAAEKEKKT